MIKYDFVIRGFIYNFSPAPFFSYITSASALDILYKVYFYIKVSFQRFSFFFSFFFF